MSKAVFGFGWLGRDEVIAKVDLNAIAAQAAGDGGGELAVAGCQVWRAGVHRVGIRAKQVHQVPIQQLLQPVGGAALAQQAAGVDLCQASFADSVVQQGRVLRHKGVTLHMG